MSARKKLDETKSLWGLDTDKELAKKLETSKANIDSWVKRDKIPDKWSLIIGQMSNNNNLHPLHVIEKLKNHISDKEVEMLEAYRTLSKRKQDIYYHKILAEALEDENNDMLKAV